jgi:DNA-binding LacI/PurR family transcriptional regulator
VRIDGAAASTEIVDRLVTAGRRSFAYISGRASSWVDKKRRGWFSDALAAFSHRPPDFLIDR